MSVTRHRHKIFIFSLLHFSLWTGRPAFAEDALKGPGPQMHAVVSEKAPREKDPFSGAEHLSRAALIQEVLEQNPSIEAARQGWAAALARYPQAVALDDPMLSYTLAPLSIGAEDVRFGQIIQLNQRLPFPGKQKLRGAIAEAEAEAARGEYEAVRLKLALMASLLFDDYYAVERSLEVNAHHVAVLEELKKSAEAQYIASRASLQDPLQAEVELAILAQMQLALETEREVITAQLNSLLHRDTALPLPPPPAALPLPEAPSLEKERLLEEALQNRPELAAAAARLQGGQAAVSLAKREFLPDFGVMGMYSSMEGAFPHQLMAGVFLEIPIQQKSRQGALDEALALRGRAEKETEALLDEIRAQVEEAYAKVEESRKILTLYKERLLPAARDQLKAARAGFEAGKNSFTALIDAEKNLRTVELKHQLALADLHRRLAQLDYALGRLPGTFEKGGA